jgi:copper chaperone CopZ
LKKLNPSIIDAVKSVEAVREVSMIEEQGTITMKIDDSMNSTPQIVKKIVDADGSVLSVNMLRLSLEETYLKLVREDRS